LKGSQFRGNTTRGGFTQKIVKPQWKRIWECLNADNGHQPDFSVACWNILADGLVSVQHFPGVEKKLFSWKERFEKILLHLRTDLQTDVICLQEVDACHVESFRTELVKDGFELCFQKRTREKVDGCAILFNVSKFQLLEEIPIQLLVEEHKILNRDNVALMLVLRHILKGKTVIVINTHLLFNPRRGEIKLAQLQLIFERLANIKERFAESSVIFCGDLNSTPASAVYHLIKTGSLESLGQHDMHQVSGQSAVIRSMKRMSRGNFGALIQHGRKQATFKGVYNPDEILLEVEEGPDDDEKELIADFLREEMEESEKQEERHNLIIGEGLKSAYARMPSATCTGEPAFTSFHANFRGCVDYIFHSHDLNTHSVFSMPHFRAFGFSLPNEACPSDHVSLAAKFRFM